jgi:hypothetical protein
MGEWIGLLVLLQLSYGPSKFHAYDRWGQGLSGGQPIPHSLHVVQVLTDGPV